MSEQEETPEKPERGVFLRSVFGPFKSRVLVEMSTDKAREMFGDDLQGSGGQVLNAVERDLEKVRAGDEVLADSALAATALQLAFEMDHPYNSATSKSMCAKVLRDLLTEIRAMAPPAKKSDTIDALAARRAERHGRDAAAQG